jgi:mannose-1-phosphate guanylyltransferase
MVGRDVIIGRDVVLSGGLTVGRDCWLRPGSTVKQSVLLPGPYMGDGAYLEDCIVGCVYDVRPGERIKGACLSVGPLPGFLVAICKEKVFD